MMAGLELENPFSHLKLSSWDPLRFVCRFAMIHDSAMTASIMTDCRMHCRKVVGRSQCPTCGRSRKFYCYSCYCLIGLDASDVPRIKLPIKIDMYVSISDGYYPARMRKG